MSESNFKFKLGGQRGGGGSSIHREESQKPQDFDPTQSFNGIADLKASSTKISFAQENPAPPTPPILRSAPSSSPASTPTSIRRRASSIKEINRTEWVLMAMKKYPEIQDLRERLKPATRAATFGMMYNNRTDVKNELTPEIVVQLIMQHLNYEGLKTSRKLLEEESSIEYTNPDLKESRLLSLLRLGIMDTEKVWDLTIADKPSHAGAEDQELEEHLYNMGWLEEEKEVEDVNIWEEPEVNNIAYDNNKDIKAASLNKLVERLTSEKNLDLNYVKTFLMTYQSFTTPEKLLSKLIQRYHVPQQEGISEQEWKNTIVMPIQLRVCNVIKKWVEEYFTDFENNDKLIQMFQNFTEVTLRLDGNSNLSKSLSNALQRKLKGESADKKETVFSADPPEPKVPVRTIFSSNLTLFDVDEEEIARQLTLVEFEIYSSIKASELLNQSWNKPKLKHRSPNVLQMIARFNDLSNWVTATILKEERLKSRARMWAKLIKIAEHCHNLNNFNSLMAIIAGINNSAVHRMKFTKEELPSRVNKTFTELEKVMNNDQAYKVYRDHLSRVDPPCIPYLGVYLTDLTFIEEGNPDITQNLINFAKRRLIYHVIAQIQQYQQKGYNLYPIHQISRFFHKFKRVDEEELYKLSLLREPRGKEKSELL
eukprot:TRINITY_DN9231_c0_g1_i1.p1 TRINITY_DN9231_c0_g1~~TRINITY_DN9231_c0_g1_i1.p1  ORF type:complete len:652 (-),score=199.83 TRINITY_DN9231_c0_g1_i1:128-2083(-)